MGSCVLNEVLLCVQSRRRQRSQEAVSLATAQ